MSVTFYPSVKFSSVWCNKKVYVSQTAYFLFHRQSSSLSFIVVTSCSRGNFSSRTSLWYLLFCECEPQTKRYNEGQVLGETLERRKSDNSPNLGLTKNMNVKKEWYFYLNIPPDVSPGILLSQGLGMRDKDKGSSQKYFSVPSLSLFQLWIPKNDWRQEIIDVTSTHTSSYQLWWSLKHASLPFLLHPRETKCNFSANLFSKSSDTLFSSTANL